MAQKGTRDLVNDFLGSAHVFASAVSSVIEKQILSEVAENKITVSQLKLLKLVSLTDSQTVGDVANFLGISNAAASKAVDKLVKMMMLKRTEGENDRRSIHLSLNGPGRRLLTAYDSARQRKLEEIFEEFPAGDLKQAAMLLDRLSARIVDHSNSEEMCLQCGIYFREKCLLRKLLSRNCLYQQHKEKGANGNGYGAGESCDFTLAAHH